MTVLIRIDLDMSTGVCDEHARARFHTHQTPIRVRGDWSLYFVAKLTLTFGHVEAGCWRTGRSTSLELY